ncbi:esterase superfamily protein [Streptococcus pneumoniae]|nr:esterase superfamily protein [Streptococcus pneumoniae]
MQKNGKLRKEKTKCILNILATGVVILTVKCTLTVMDMVGPVVVFASSGGSHNEYYDFGMIDACASFIEEGRVQFFTLSSVDSESWLATWKNAHDQAEMHRAYERYVIEEAILLSSTRQVGLMA